MSNKKTMATKASKTLRSKRASKISKSFAGSVLAKSKHKREPRQLKTKQKGASKWKIL